MKFLVVLLLVALSATCYGLKCYQCKHSDPPALGVDKDEACKNSDEKYLKECTEYIVIPTGFEKTFMVSNITNLGVADGKQGLPFSCIASLAWKKGESAAFRGCIPKVADGFTEPSQGGYSQKIRFCNSDGCNNDNASSRPITMPSVIIVSLVLFISKMYY